jgi:hypothetical protein
VPKSIPTITSEHTTSHTSKNQKSLCNSEAAKIPMPYQAFGFSLAILFEFHYLRTPECILGKLSP